jgi:hypothetical protein
MSTRLNDNNDATGGTLSRGLVRGLEFAAVSPGLAALFVGGLYAGGAILWGAKLRDADLIVRDTLPLVPLPQLLAQ